MQQHIAGQLRLPKSKRQQLLHQSAGQFLLGLNRRRDAAEVQRDRMQAAPAGLLPMVF
ncbi:hypothetical protein LRS05_10605 [Flavobacterium sp. J372]|uniref:hypothetical protein n=1 Tax=Flavobacterium sp. J372 TaxID=2898436 RepID=UPI002151EFB5|nr:hypothetical protein [Flavobacterium sp. J372]MCR5862571.1 hypothetical protein [Flavobacterium sp. J372]